MTNDTQNTPNTPATPNQNTGQNTGPNTGKDIDFFDLPLYQTLNSINQCMRPLVGDLDVNKLAEQLHYTLVCDHGGTNDLEALLAGQARTLDAAFHRIVADGSGKRLSLETIDMAMKTQRQCRETLKTLRGLQAGALRDRLREFKPSALSPHKPEK